MPEDLALRTGFWHKVYSLWTTSDYVLHLGNHPEVVLEFGNSMGVPNVVATKAQNKRTRKVMRQRKNAYRRLLLAMHKSKTKDFSNSPAMQRVANAMAHIEEDKKYLKAARTIRIQRGQREFVRKGIELSSRYLPHIVSDSTRNSYKYLHLYAG